jgi:ABC-type molybdate transport system ATPase subunit
MVAVVGPSGSGKTTLLNCLSGLERIEGGQILVDGADLEKLSDNARTGYRARRMGFVFQAFNLLPVLTAVENVEIPLLLLGHRPRPAREQALAMLETLGLAVLRVEVSEQEGVLVDACEQVVLSLDPRHEAALRHRPGLRHARRGPKAGCRLAATGLRLRRRRRT